MNMRMLDVKTQQVSQCKIFENLREKASVNPEATENYLYRFAKIMSMKTLILNKFANVRTQLYTGGSSQKNLTCG